MFVNVVYPIQPYPSLLIINVYEVVKTVRMSWRKLARELLG